MNKFKILEQKVSEAIGLIRTLKEENKRLESDNLKLSSECDLLRLEVKHLQKFRTQHDEIVARDQAVRNRLLAIKSKLDSVA